MNNPDDTILETEQSDGLLRLTLNRPGSANALNPELTEALLDAVTGAQGVRLCVLQGAGRHFCAGFDLSDLENLSDGDLLWRFLRIETLLQAIHHAPFPVVAFGHGQLVGAGADLFACCWHRVAAADARFRFPGWNFELALGTRRLRRLIGPDAARDLLIDTKVISAEQGLALGLATELAPRDDWPALTERLKQRATTLSPGAIRNLLELTSEDSRNDDLAAIVTSAGRPGLKDRIVAYRDRLKASASD